MSWNGETTGYEVRINGGATETVTNPSKTFTGLTPGTAYKVEIRGICPETDEVAWQAFTLYTHQTPAILPYACDFEDEGDNGWIIRNGYCTNQWHTGTPSGVCDASSSLYIPTVDSTEKSIVIAEKLFRTDESDSLYISFDLTARDAFHCSLCIFWAPVDTNYEATADPQIRLTEGSYGSGSYTDNVIMSSNTSWRYVNLLEGTQTMRATIANEPNSLKKLIFMVRVNPNPVIPWNIIIDDIQITTEVCDTITDLTVSNITPSSADVSWSGSATNYQVRVNGRAVETINTANKHITDLTQGAENLVEVRAVCENNYSAWTRLKFETQPAILPYTCDFECNDGWILKNGTCTNQWHVGSPSGAESASLYISGDGGTTAGYHPHSSVVVAEKVFQTGTSDYLSVSFDLTIGGYDTHINYLKIFWVPADTNYEATTNSTVYYTGHSYATNVIMDDRYKWHRDNVLMENNNTEKYVNLLNGTKNIRAVIANEPNSLKKLVFVWVHRGGNEVQPGAIIDNIRIAPTCLLVTDITANNITETSAEVSWNGETTGYEVRINGGATETITTPSKTFTGLTPGTAYKVEIRGICPETDEAAWQAFTLYTHQTPAILPYACDFEDEGDNGWIIRNGYCTNQWHVGNFDSPAGHSGSLYMSGDGGTTAGYNTSESSVVIAEKLFQTDESDSLRISFDLTIGGKEYDDYLKVFWVPADTNYEATTDRRIYDFARYAYSSFAGNVIMSSHSSSRFVNLLEGTRTMMATIANEPNSLKKLVFVWVNKGGNGVQPGAIIDNIQVIGICSSVTDLAASNITATSAEISWNGRTTAYEVRLNGSAADTVTSTSKTFTDLTNGTEYMVEVRSLCGSSESAWDTVLFTTFCSTVTDIIVSNIIDTSAEVSWNGSANEYEVRLNGIAIDTTTSTSKALINLTEETNYTVEVRAVCAENISEWSSVNFTTTQIPTALPYACDFEASGNNGWKLKNGSCINKWYVGTPAGAESASLYISGDGGTTAGYNTGNASSVIAEKLFQTGESDFISVSFDLTIKGEAMFDYLKVFWVPADTNYEPTLYWDYYNTQNYAINVIMNNAQGTGVPYVCLLDGTQNMKAVIANEHNSLKKLVFVWHNDGARGYQPGAIIDNIRIAPTCPPVTDLAAGNITATSAEISWNGRTTAYEIRLNGGAADTVTGTSKTFTDLTPGTTYTVEVRGVCSEMNDADWQAVTFYTTQIPATLPYTCDFEAEGNNGWVLENGTCTNRWYIGTPDSATNASLYISGDNGATAGYNTDAESVVVAEKLFQTGTSDSLQISFDLTIKGEAMFDYLKVFWIPADTNYEAIAHERPYYSTAFYITNVIMNNAANANYRYVSELDDMQRMSVVIANEPNSLKKLVFVWRNDVNRGTQPGAIIDNIQVIGVCPSVTDLAVSNITETSAEISWNGSASNYEVRFNGGAAETVTSTNKTFTDLTNGTEYMVEVRSLCGSSESAWDTVRFTTLCSPVTDLATNNITATSAEISWNGSASNYEVRLNGGAADTVTGTSKTFSDLSNGTEYLVVVKSICSSNESEWDTVRFTTLCSSVTDLTASNITETSAEISWNGSASNYEVRLNGGAADTVTSTSKTFTDLTNGTEYMVEVRSVCSSNESEWDTVRFTTLCPSVTDLAANNITATSAEISWNGSASNYEVRFNGGAAETVTSTNKTFTDLTNGTEYMVEVRSLCGSSESAWDTVRFTTLCSPVTDLAANNITETSVEISWNGSANGYQVRLNGGATETVASTNKVFTGLTYGTEHLVEVRAVCSDSESVWDSLTFTTICPSVTHLNVSNITATSAEVGWKNGPAYNYEIRINGGAIDTTINTGKVFTDLTEEEEYLVEVRAVCADSESEWDTVRFITTCPSVSYLAVNNITETSAEVSWNGRANGYEVRINGGDAETVASTNKVFTDLTTGTEYIVEVRGVCAVSESDWDTVRFTTLCSSVTDLTANNITATSAEISWNGSAAEYQIRLNGGAAETVTTTSKTFTDLTEETEYMVEVRAVCVANESEWDTVRFTTANSAGLEQVVANMEVLIYPNPAKHKAVLSLSGLTEDARLIVGDIQGKIVLTDSIVKCSELYELDLKGFASGVYSVTIVSGNNKATHKLIVE